MRISPVLTACALVAATACGGRGGAGPAWPKASVSAVDQDHPEDDGGESLDPRQPEAVASVEASEDATPADPAAPATTEATGVEDPGAAPPPSSTPATGEEPVLDGGEIVIEVTGD